MVLAVWGLAALASGSSGTVHNTANGGTDGSVLMTSRPLPYRPSNPPPASVAARASSTSATSSLAPTVSGQPALPAPPPTSATPPPPPQPCPDPAVSVAAQVDRPSFPAGQRAQFTIAIGTNGPVPCTRDIDRGLRELLVQTPDGHRLWSSNDCYQATGGGVQLLTPGHQMTFSLTWVPRTSAPGCPLHRDTIPAGNYVLLARLGPITSPPTPFTLT